VQSPDAGAIRQTLGLRNYNKQKDKEKSKEAKVKNKKINNK
jgi:hypothetical protein